MKLPKNLNAFHGVFVRWLPASKALRKIERVMWRHHWLKDFAMPRGSLKTMLAHDQEYAELMAEFATFFCKDLERAGYIPERGDGVGVCLDSSRHGFLMYTPGNLVTPGKRR